MMDSISWMTSMSVWLAFSMTSFLVTSRAALLWLLRLYKYEQIHPATWYTVVLVLLEVPHISNLIYILWNTPIISAANRQPLPKTSHVIIGMMSSVLEGVATATFATEVAHALPEPVLLTLPYATLTFVTLKDLLAHSKRTSKHSPETSCGTTCLRTRLSKCLGLLVFSYSFWVASGVGAILCVWSKYGLSAESCIVLSLCSLLLSATWNPEVQKLILLSENTGMRCTTVDLLYIPIKTLAVFVALFLSLIFKLPDFREYTVESMRFAIHEFSDIRIWLPVVLCCLAGFLSFMNTVAASKVCLITPGMKIPMFLCPALSILATAVLWNDFETNAFWELSGNGVVAWTAIGLSAAVWFIPFILPGFSGFKNPPLIERDIRESFYSFSWNAFFLEPRAIMNYEAKSVGKQIQNEISSDKSSRPGKKTLFICTTMYKESEIEMTRYLRSIKNVFANNDENKIHIEAHVFFDSSVVNDQINPRGRHLLSLMCDMFQLDVSDLEKVSTPYGCQIHTRTLLNHLVFIHFKDPIKVKAKKRWSQVMYMHYVLQFRNSQLSTFDKEVHLDYSPKTKKRFQDNVFCLENDLSVPNSFQKINCSYNTINHSMYSECLLSAVGEGNHDHTEKKIASPATDNGHHLPRLRCCCSAASLSSSSLLDQISAYPGKSDNNFAQFFTCSCGTGTNMPTQEETCGEGNGSRHSCSRKSSFSTDTSDRDLSSSSGIFSTKTYSSCDTPTTRIESKIKPKESKGSLDNVFLLTTDADTEFSAKSVSHVLEQCEADPSLGAVCGRTVPVGSAKPIVWYQKFEYAKDFWLVKSSQNVIGSVTCCPGCFSIYRGDAVAAITEEFSQPTCSAFDNLVMDHGEDRWLCTLLMLSGWRLAYSSHAHNSTHCPETVGEFLRQRRRWVLSELSNMASIFMSVPSLVRNNSSFSAMFLISLFTTFLWVILSPSTTLVFMCAGMDVLYNIPLKFTLPIAMTLFFAYCTVCYLANQNKQKMASLVMTFAMALTVVILGVGFIIYVVQAIQRDLQIWGYVQFRPYFLVFLLVISIVYAALLHPRESLSLIYGFAYALLFPAMFVVLPGYALANMIDQSWGTRESGSHGCCQVPQDEEDEHAFSDFTTTISALPTLANQRDGESENKFWKNLQVKYIGNDVNTGKSAHVLSQALRRLRCITVSIFIAVNVVWFSCLSVLYAYAGSDVICYCVAAIFSFSLLVQLIGLTCYKCNTLLERYLQRNMNTYSKQATNS